jgi:3-hydroxyisobutyrate dehydrogenase-like beta-hydroxyacid dehydrogenase
MKERIGFIGVDAMGSCTAGNLLKDWSVTVLDHRKREVIEKLLASRRQRRRAEGTCKQATSSFSA